ncbi:MAG: NADH-quinone oxidoreductase subunit M [Synechococcales cyanobacterium CRU_2_2]|nr:NADH-quinone oxidoreductase subunit M [Synechococcales cyanobacterium CRU_2_2]
MLSTLIWLPIIGALIIAFAPVKLTAQRARDLALAASGTTLLWTIWLLTQFDLTTVSFQMREFLPWLPMLGLNYDLAVDGLSMMMIGLNSLLGWIAIYSSAEDTERPRFFYALILLVSGGVAGAFLAQNLLLFFLLFEIELVPLYFLISIWGGEKRDYAAMKFLLYTAIAGALILTGFIGTVWLGGSLDFSYDSVSQLKLPWAGQIVLLSILLVGFGIKIPLVPFHTWLPDTYVSASPPVAILLGGVLAKLGTYGIFRFGLGLFPDAWAVLSPILAVWAAVSVLYGSVTAIAQKDIKRMVAYSSIGHMGYVMLGGAAFTKLSLIGAISQMVSHGLILALLFHLVGLVEAKVGTRQLDVLNGLMNPLRGLPMVSALLVLSGMASAGIPGLVGFITEFLVFQGSYSVFPVQTLLCVVGTGLTAVYFVILINRTCFGRLDSQTAYYGKVTFNERVPALVLATLVVLFGLQPNWLVHWSAATSGAMVTAISMVETAQVDSASASVYP